MSAKLSPEVHDALTSVITQIVNEAVDKALAEKVAPKKPLAPVTNDNRQPGGFKLPKGN